MKKIIFFTLAVLACSTAASNAQSISLSKVPMAVKNAFAKDYPNVKKASWELEKGNYEAGYANGKLENSVFYSPSGKMVKYETGIEVSQLPASASVYIKKNFPGKVLQETAKVTTATGSVSYLAVVKGSKKARLFDANGKYVETVTD